jgi:hypothetical protein
MADAEMHENGWHKVKLDDRDTPTKQPSRQPNLKVGRTSECTSNTRISLNMHIAHVAQFLSLVIADQICDSTRSLTTGISEQNKEKFI